MKSLNTLIEHLRSVHVLNTQNIIDAFRKIDRRDFVTDETLSSAYEDIPLLIGHGQTISQPYTVAFMLELLSPQKGEHILDVGSGSGYTTALLAEIVGKGGSVVGVEIISELVSFGKKNLSKYNFAHVLICQAKKKLGFLSKAPYDKIIVSASLKEISKELIAQLKTGGVMVVPVGHDILKIEKYSNTDVRIKKYPGFVFVSLV